RARPARVAGLLGIAPAPDVTRRMWQEDFGDAEREAIQRDGRVTVPSEYSEDGYVITRNLLEEAEQHMLLDAPIPIRCPVRLLHGMRDEAVPWETSLRIAERLETDDVEATLVASGDHRLSEPTDLERMLRTLEDLTNAASVQDD
ncbi:MAG: alpha/beta hydrolase, partial [Rhodospirillales bacterium]|nr:alpha/beta hydrolase [Rhodospirillales bacterium]